MNPGNGYIAVESNAPLRGLATTTPSTRIDPSYSPKLLNCVVRNGEVKRRGGYQQIGQRLVGRVLAITEFGELGENTNLVVLTSHRQYVFDVATNTFTDLTPDQVSLPLLYAVGTKFKIAGDSTAYFTAGVLFPVEGGASDGVYTVVSSAFVTGNTEITVLETIPADPTPTGSIIQATQLNTGERDLIDYIALTDITSHRFLVTNGRDPVLVWDGNTGNPFEEWLPSFTDFVTCKSFAVFAEHLFLGGITTTEFEPQTVAWSAAGDFDEFDDTSSDAGAQILYPLTLGVVGMRNLGDRLAIYSSDAIMTGVYVGSPAIFAFETVIPEGTRLISPKSIVSINVGHIYLSEENVYLFDGSRGLRTLGDMIYTDYKNTKDQEYLYRSAALNDYSKRTIFFAVPDVSGGSIIYTAEYDVFDLGRITWAKEKYAHNPRAWGFFKNHSVPVTWEDLDWEPADTPWRAELGAWAEESEQLEFPIRCFGTDDGYVFLVTEGIITDNEETTEQIYETMDFTIPEAFHSIQGRWGELEFEAAGTDVDVYVSRNLGSSFEYIDSRDTLTTAYKTFAMRFDLTARTMRVRFISSSDFKLRWIRLWVRPAGPR